MKALDELQPDIVLVEAPADADGALRVDRRRRARPAGRHARLRRRPTRSGPCSHRSPRSAPNGRRSRWANAHGVAVEAIDLPLANTLPGAPTTPRSTSRATDGAPSIRSAPWPRPPASPTPNAGGTTWSSTAATARRRSRPSPRRWRRCARAPCHRPASSGARRTCAGAIRAAMSRRRRHGRRRLRGVARAGARPRRHIGGRRQRHAARPAQGQSRRELGAMDAPAPRRGHRLRRRGPSSRVVRPRVPPSRARGRHPVLRRRRPPAARRRHRRPRPTTSSRRSRMAETLSSCAAARVPVSTRYSTPPTR